MLPDELDDLTLPDLITLLAKETKYLLELMTQKHADGIVVRDKRQEVKRIQEAIDKKKKVNR